MHHLPSRHRVSPYVVGVIIGLALMAPSVAFAVIHPAGDVPLPEGFETARPATSLLMTADEAAAARSAALAEWQAALAQ